MRVATCGGSEMRSFLLACMSTEQIYWENMGSISRAFGARGCWCPLTSSSDGAPTRSNRHRLRMGPMILLVELAHKMTRKFAVNFSIVRRSADWASRESRSASLMMTTAKAERSSQTSPDAAVHLAKQAHP